MENVTRNFNIYMDLSMILRIAALIISIAACCFSFYNLGYITGRAREREDRWLTDERLLDSLRVIQKGIGEIQLILIRLFLKDRDHNESDEQQ